MANGSEISEMRVFFGVTLPLDRELCSSNEHIQIEFISGDVH